MDALDLSALPNGWDALTSEQMVRINRIRYEQGSSKEMFLFHVFCYLTGLEATGSQKDEEGQTEYVFLHTESKKMVAMSAWEVQFFIAEDLKWLTEDCTRLMDVFPTLILRGKTFRSPGYAMAGMTYMQYKKAQDYMVYYHRLQMRIISLLRQAEKGKVTVEQVQEVLDERLSVQGKFLAAVYTPESLIRQRTVDGQVVVCQPPEKSAVFSTQQIEMYGEWFEELPEEKAEAIIQLFSGTMLNYRKMFPLLFPEKSEDNSPKMNFIQVESSTMNALQDKLKFNNYQTIYDSNAPFILEKLHAILKEGKALDEQHRKMKAKRK